MLTVFHIGCLGKWKDVVNECLSITDLPNLHITMSGAKLCDINWVRKYVKDNNIQAIISNCCENMKEYEFPGIRKVEELARNADENIMYFHTKGVSADCKKPWRDIMLNSLVKDWRHWNAQIVQRQARAAGFDLYYDFQYPHFSGNYWIASASHIRGLVSATKGIDTFKKRFGKFMGERFAAEFYILSQSRLVTGSHKKRFFKQVIPVRAINNEPIDANDEEYINYITTRC